MIMFMTNHSQRGLPLVKEVIGKNKIFLLLKSKYMTQKEAVKGLRILYPIWMVVGMFSIMYVPSKLITLDAGQTAKKISLRMNFFLELV